MEEDNDDQWLYGEDSTTEKSATNDASTDKVENDIFSEKGNEAFINPPDTTDDNTVDLEPPIIKPPGISSFDEGSVVPGEEELMVTLNPPIISAPEKTLETSEETQEDQNFVNGETGENAEVAEKTNETKLSEGEEEDDEDDNINVVIGDIRTTPSYNSNLHIKRGNLLTLTKVYNRYKPNYYQQPQYQQTGKFAVDDFESVGLINGVPAHEFNLDNLEDKPWRKPGADITDYFNYGFNEDTWRAYCERQKRMRVHESGSGLIPMNQQSNMNLIPNVSVPPPNLVVPPIGLNNATDGNPGSINVIGGVSTRRANEPFAKENTIQVMTADRREYSKKNFTPDLSVPPPVVPPPYANIPPGIPPPFPPMNQYGPPPGEYFAPEMDPYYHPYEPPQDPNWGGQSWGGNIDMKNMIPLSNGGDAQARGVNGNADVKPNTDNIPNVKIKTEPEDRESGYEHDRERSRDYDRERDRDSRHRERSHRHRSRSRSHERRSRKHKSRSRSPSYRSHKKKKSKKSERSKSESD